jgi:hypothetical protein
MKTILHNIKVIPSFELKTKADDKEKKYKSDLEKPKKIKKDNSKDQIKYFIPL